jgi:hypothetical protein
LATTLPQPLGAGGVLVAGIMSGVSVDAGACQVLQVTFQAAGAAAGALGLDDNAALEAANVSLSLSSCENLQSGAGSLTGGTITGVLSPGPGSFDCTLPVGSPYARVGVVVTITAPATTCVIDGTAYAMDLEFVGGYAPLELLPHTAAAVGPTPARAAGVTGVWTAAPEVR